MDELSYECADLDEYEDDDLMLILREMMFFEQGKNVSSIVNPPQMRKMAVVFKVMSRICKEQGLSISKEINSPFVGNGAIDVIGKKINVLNTKEFVTVSKLADSVDIVPRTDGRVQLVFGFENVTIRVEE